MYTTLKLEELEPPTLILDVVVYHSLEMEEFENLIRNIRIFGYPTLCLGMME